MWRRMFKTSFYFAPDEPASQGGSGEPLLAGVPDQPTATPSPAASPPSGGTPAAQASPPAAPQPSPLDPLKPFLPKDFNGDLTAAQQHILQERARLTQLAQLGQQVYPHLSEFQKWQQAQQQAAQQAQAQQQQIPWHKQLGLWNPPEFDPAWLNQVERDANGALKVKDGHAPDTVYKLQSYMNYVAEQEKKFFSNPFEYMAPAIAHVAQQVAAQMIEQRFGSYQQTQEARGFIEQNADWLFERDAQGNLDQTKLNPWGNLFAGYLKQADEYVLSQGGNPAAYHKMNRDWALSKVTADVARFKFAQANAPAAAASAGEAAKERFLANGNAPPNPRGSANVVPAPTASGQTLEQKMLADLRAAGINPGDNLN